MQRQHPINQARAHHRETNADRHAERSPQSPPRRDHRPHQRRTRRTVTQHPREIRARLEHVITNGDSPERKAIIEELIAEIRIIGDEIIPVFRLPRDEPVAMDAATPATSTGDGNEPDPVRAMPNLVGRRYHHANRTATIAGDPLPLSLPSSRVPGDARVSGASRRCYSFR
jgi:hypothetical protein